MIASRLSSGLGIPGLLVFLAVGMLAGSDGPGGIYFDNAEVSQTLGVVALAYILFSGGLSTNWDEIRPVLRQGRSSVSGQALVDVGLPVGTMIVLIERDGEFVVPTGSTVLREGDRLLVLGDDDSIRRLRRRLDGVEPE
ncbi:MAG: TrkA C-terminal domain-containing protein [Acidimicrobiales bacterium]